MLNEVNLIGHCGQDPDITHTASGVQKCRLSLATTRKWRDKTSGQLQEQTEWHRVILWDKLAEIAGRYLTKGSQAHIRGEIRTRTWEDGGVKKYIVEIHADKLTLLGGKGQGGGTGGGYAPPAPGTGGDRATYQAHQAAQAPAAAVDFDDDIPF